MPVKEISAESVRDGRIQHGHISSLHKWWARRPLPVCRAVVFASLVPDPLDENCPEQFKKAVEILLGKKNDLPGDPYKPYEDIPHTVVVDKMEDNLRNRLMMFIGKFSDKYVQNERLGKKTAAKEKLHQYSLIKWDNKNDDKIIGRARKLIFVSHNADSGKTIEELLSYYDQLNKAIKDAEAKLYNYPNRHIQTDEVKALEQAKDKAISSFLAKMPKVFDPFAGGGAIPLEAARLGCNSYGNDINPVAHIIQKGSCEFPQKYGKPITYTIDEFENIYGKKEFEKQRVEGNVFGKNVNLSNRLAHDVEFYAHKLLEKVVSEIGEFYPKDKEGNEPMAYYWARIGKCGNPTCGAEIPLLKQLYLIKKGNDSVYLEPIIGDKTISFEIRNGLTNQNGFVGRNSLKCPCCNNVTPITTIKKQSIKLNGKLPEKLIAVVYSRKGRKYRLPYVGEEKLAKIKDEELDLMLIPSEKMLEVPDLVSGRGWGVSKWSDLFTKRQLLTIQTFIRNFKVESENELSDYDKAVKTYIAIWINRLITRSTSFGLFDITNGGKINDLFGRQAIPMIYDFPEINPLINDQLSWVLRLIKSENFDISAICLNSESGQIHQFQKKSLEAVVTDPPYYDAIAYADLSDFFYVWFKKSLSNIYPLNFLTPQTPKSDECTALKHHHNNSMVHADRHFEESLLKNFSAISEQTNGIVSIMFAHQTIKAWTTLCNSVLNSGMNLKSSWPVDSESVSVGLKKNKAFLSSSITVSCQPSIKSGIGDYKEVQKEILQVIKKEVRLLYDLGFRGADY